MNGEERKAVGIWIRVSTEDQVRGESPEHHEMRARMYADLKGWQIVETYRLDAISGKTVKEHPEARRMLSDVRNGRISGLVFSKLARLARNTRELLEFAEIFRESGADLVSLAESIDTSTPAGRFFYTMIAAMAQWERDEIADRVAASVPIRAKLGKPLGGAAPYGFKWEDKKLVVNPDEAPIRKLLYELYLEHRRIKTVARIMNDRGYRTRSGAAWSDTTVSRLISDQTARGTRVANYTKSTKNGGAWVMKPKDEWVHVPVEPIVSEELWADCNAIRSAHRASGARQTKRVTHLFAGFAICHCGNKMYVPKSSPKYVCYSCRNKIPIVDLEAIFAEQLKSFVFSKEEIRDHLAQGSARLAHEEELLATRHSEQRKLTTESDKLYDLYQSGAIDKAGFRRRNEKLAEQLGQIEDELPQIEGRRDALKIALLSQEDVLEEARDLYGRWQSLSHENKRRIVETIVERIVISDGEVEITLLYSPSGSGDSGGTPPPTGGVPPSTPPSEMGDKRATQLCPCGHIGDPSGRCRCTPDAIARYRARLSGPLLDRIDLKLEVPRVPLSELRTAAAGESSAAVRERVAAARERQLRRSGKPNATLGNREIDRDCRLGRSEQALFDRAVEKLGLSARAYHRVLRVARTIADLAGSADIETAQIAEAIQFRRFDLR